MIDISAVILGVYIVAALAVIFLPRSGGTNVNPPPTYRRPPPPPAPPLKTKSS